MKKVVLKEEEKIVNVNDVSTKKIYFFKISKGYGSLHQTVNDSGVWKHFWFGSAFTLGNSGDKSFLTLEACVGYWIREGWEIYEFNGIKEAIAWLHAEYEGKG